MVLETITMMAYDTIMNAEFIIRKRVVLGDGDVVEAVVWKVAEPVPPTEHGFKYRLVLISGGLRVVGFDNERGRGDHRHDEAAVIPYQFLSIDQLLEDFTSAVENWRIKHGRS
ncbi:toxin-antitoxin system TumE family protein [Magnetospirillum fulvum]|uniref:toxin-antitoxin system TumE family protein n=1 Tax=Magnetospirillum fulvum TaxID=1082 RepID=UPI000AC090AD|nr:DUF6516 family protein [Magnetospirillum fulvum]